MVDYKLTQLVAAVQGAMGVAFRVSVVKRGGNTERAHFQLEAVDLMKKDRSARSKTYPMSYKGPLSDLIGLCANTLKAQLQMEASGAPPRSPR